MTDAITYELVQQAVEAIRARLAFRPAVGLILGSGLSSLGDRIRGGTAIPYSEIPGFIPSTVPGHAGRLLLGKWADRPVVMMQGRVHHYEGHSAAAMTFPVRVMRALGAEVLIVTNAAGGIARALLPGDLMAITDHINLPGLTGHNPLRGPNDDRLGPRFPDMSPAYDPALLDILRAVAAEQGIPLDEGVYAMVGGPSYETPAEVRFLRAIGADAVGMSTAPEVVVARHCGLRVLGLSLITNVATDTLAAEAQVETTHAQVMATAERSVPVLGRLIEGVLRRL